MEKPLVLQIDELIEKSLSKVLDLALIVPYSKSAQQKAVELALVGYNSLAHTVRSGLFLCVFSPLMRFMVKSEGDTFVCAGTLTSQSTNPLWLCHHHLVVNGKASKKSLGASSVSTLHSEFQDQTEVSHNQMQMLWSLFSQIQQNIKNNCPQNNYHLAEIGNYLTEMWTADYEETLTQLNSQESNNV